MGLGVDDMFVLPHYFEENCHVSVTHRMSQGVRNVSTIPVGLGQNTSTLGAKDVEHVANCYFRAQFELLSEEDWGFENYYINPRGYLSTARDILNRGLEVLGAYNNKKEGMYLRCNIVFHQKDAKFLAQKLADAGKAPAYINGSCYTALLQGRVGQYWEQGRNWNYTGEEDWAATSTGVLGDFSICGKVVFPDAPTERNMDRRPTDSQDDLNPLTPS
eukprot:TRINITY_DN17024_c0_g1_i2.p1 TRINITY_DN17024_c0_g1~~TRINITY_DN17024_c0_g1_i2.p1  ORF type:complete len:217 (+),score=59.79 TRINITY_DN17024_c0_g1_i2:2-652(+)